MLKVSTYFAETDHGYTTVPLFGPADSVFEKTAAAGLQPEVLKYINSLRPRNDAQYVLVNAMGASEYFGSNVNGDYFSEASLIHAPPSVSGNPLLDKRLADEAGYGYLTFYNAHAFAHHKNKDASRAYGDVELAVWNDYMKRVELVVRVDYDKCIRFGGTAVWDKLVKGMHPDVSMGSKVPFDTCSITLDWKLYREAEATFNPKKHKHPGVAILEFHNDLKRRTGRGIRGLSVTRSDYSDYCLNRMNQILPDGRKVFVYNDFPRFFDISFVFIGADRTAKVMVYIVRSGVVQPVSSALAAEQLNITGDKEEKTKTASAPMNALEELFGKLAANKHGTIDKEITPNLPPAKAVKLLEERERGIPEDALATMKSNPLNRVLSTLSGLGILLSLREFARVAGDASSDQVSPTEKDFSPALARLLMPLMSDRSGLGPFVEHRVVMVGAQPKKSDAVEEKTSSLSTEALRKIGAAYNAYRSGVMDIVAHAADFIDSSAKSSEDHLHKLSATSANELFTPLAFEYLTNAYRNEAVLGDT